MRLVEAKFGSRIRDSKPSDTGSRGHSDPMDVDAVNSLSSGKGKGSSSARDACCKCGGAHFQRDCNAPKSTGKQSSGKAKQSKSWSKSEGKRKSKENNETSKGKSKGTKGAIQGAEGSHKGKTSKTGLSGLENSKSETSSETQESAQTCPTDNLWIHDAWSPDEWNDGWSFDKWNDDWIFVGWHEGWGRTFDNSGSSFSLAGLDLGATRSPKLFEWVRAAVNRFPLNFGPDGAGDGRFYRTASGKWIPDHGAWQFQGYDGNGLLRQDFHLGYDGGYMIPMHSKIGQSMRIIFEKLVNWHGKNELIPVYLDNIFSIST